MYFVESFTLFGNHKEIFQRCPWWYVGTGSWTSEMLSSLNFYFFNSDWRLKVF